jgi:hypothetical protein
MASKGMTHPGLMVIAAAVGVVLMAILLPFFWLAVWRRKNWARWVLLVLFAISLPGLFLDPEPFVRDHLPSTIIGFGATFVEIIAFFFLFTGDAKPWFRRETPDGSAHVLPEKS